MTDRRGLLGGVFMIVGAIPLAIVYGNHPIGYLALGLIVLGAAVIYGAYKVV